MSAAPRRAAALAIAFGIAALAPAALADPDSPSTIHMNQVGFETSGPKTVIARSDAAAPLPWSVIGANGESVLQGRTTPFGHDAKSDTHVHQVDISALAAPGTYRLRVGETESRAFAVADRPFDELKYDALHYFYHNRSGTEVAAEYVGETWARPAGHAPDIATCFAGEDRNGVSWNGCAHTLDGTGGWYDAGDHGKYVVNGGVAVWTLQNAYERALARGVADAFADGRHAIPEVGDGINDLLNEARWGMEWLLAMQAPEGATAWAPVGPIGEDGSLPAAQEIEAGGLAHHKLTGLRWTALPLAPHDDVEPRALFPPSTGATLNLAATAAQCARVWRPLDPAFAQRCENAAKTAYAAAERHPAIHASGAFDGGGPYGDDDFSDEFYWAATELWRTTGEPRYAAAAAASAHAPTGDAAMPAISWNSVAALGPLSLALAPEGFADEARTAAKGAIVATADGYLAQRDGEGYALPFGAIGYHWGSNGQWSNHAMIMAYAADITGAGRYRHGVLDVMDYLLGRNPLDRSFVAGYGARSMRTPHHRHWAHGADPAFPIAPPGALSGGPNDDNMADEVAQAMEGACPTQLCWADDVRAYALNEVAVNWNAPLVWIAAYLDE